MIKVNKCIKSFSFAIKGVYAFFKNENNAKVHLLASLLVVSAGFYFNLSKTEWLWICVSIALVWITEAVNTAIEKLVDLISPEFNPKAGEIKDLAAGAVLLAALFSLMVALLIFIPKII